MADNFNSLASAVIHILEIHSDNQAGNFGCVLIIDFSQQHLCHFIDTFQSLCAKS